VATVQTPDAPAIEARFPAWAAAWWDSHYLAIHGSEAYGLATDESDIDLKGVFIPWRDSLLGYRDLPPEQLEFSPDPSTPGRLLGPHDAAIYSLQKLCRLGAACNPNAVEMLFVEERHVIRMTPVGERIRALGPAFLSLRARQTFGEYARGQLRRMEQHRRWLRDPPQAPPTRVAYGLPEHGLVSPEQRDLAEQAVREVMDRWQLDLDGLLPHQAIALQARVTDFLTDVASAVGYTGETATDDLRFVAAARQVGIDGDLLEALRRERRFKAAVREWGQYQEWQRTRNPKRAALERAHGYDTKHATHLVRLMRTCRDLVVDGVMRVYRPDRDELVAIKHGAWRYEQLVEDVARHGAEADAAIREGRSPLPDAPDEAAINELCVQLTNEWSDVGAGAGAARGGEG
jgi:predicted nucleotidyltransferase